MGIRKKISVGFLCLALMLAFSGMISLFELNRLSKDTRDILENSSYNLELSKKMLDAVQEQNTALLQMIVLGDYDRSFFSGKEEFENTLQEATQTINDRIELDSIYIARKDYYELVTKLFDDTVNTDIEWFLDMYRTSYSALTSSIKSYMLNSQNSLISKATELRSNAYRAIMPGIITLCVAILMVLIFAYLIDIYYTQPLIGITEGLKKYINNKVPFNVKLEGHDEIFRLREYIESLITALRKK